MMNRKGCGRKRSIYYPCVYLEKLIKIGEDLVQGGSALTRIRTVNLQKI